MPSLQSSLHILYKTFMQNKVLFHDINKLDSSKPWFNDALEKLIIKTTNQKFMQMILLTKCSEKFYHSVWSLSALSYLTQVYKMCLSLIRQD